MWTFLVHNFEHHRHFFMRIMLSIGSHCSFWNICAELSNSLASSINLLQRFCALRILNSWSFGALPQTEQQYSKIGFTSASNNNFLQWRLR